MKRDEMVSGGFNGKDVSQRIHENGPIPRAKQYIQPIIALIP